MKNYFLRHFQTLFFSLGQLWSTPIATLMTVAVLGITLALPAGLFIVLENAQQASGAIKDSAQISVFLKKSVSESSAKKISKNLAQHKNIERTRYISAKEALAEFKKYSGFGDAIKAMKKNPLPAVIIVTPKQGTASPAALANLLATIKKNDQVELAQLDLEWVKRLSAFLVLAKRGVWLLAVLLGLGVILTIGNTIRLAVTNRRSEIEITKLVGGTNAFIRRPFLYSGLIQGLLGAFGAWLLVQGGLLVIAEPMSRLTALYASQLEIRGLDGSQTGLLLLIGASLGWLGSRLAVGRHLREINPT